MRTHDRYPLEGITDLLLFYEIRSALEADILPCLKASHPDLRSRLEEEDKEPRDVKCAPFRL
jgi:hypothetical protein